MKKMIVSLGAVALLSTALFASEQKKHEQKHEQKHWDYSQNGPTHWEEFSKTCGKGNYQSPVNIIPGKTMSMDPEYDLEMHDDITGVARIIDNGHSIKVTPEHGGSITLNGQKFNLLQFHFHGKSEHTINGKRYDMVAHMVHQNPKTKQLAVVAVFFTEGKENKVLEKIIHNVGGKVKINPQDFVPLQTAHYYHYVGSLTTPPCSENVQWYLLKTPQPATKEQIAHFRKYYVDNERPIQELHDRVIDSK